jgi:hypothetical protein
VLTVLVSSQGVVDTATGLTVSALVAGLGVLGLAYQVYRRGGIAAAQSESQRTLEERLEELSKSMRDSARLVEEVSTELDARAVTARRLKEEAETAEALAGLHKEQADAGCGASRGRAPYSW